MKTLNKTILLRMNVIIVMLAFVFSSAFAKEIPGRKKQASNLKSIAAGCTPALAKEEMAINNVRTTILVNGDMWWDATTQDGPQYEIPKGGLKHSLFTGSLWIGGIDASNQLKVAAQTYRQDGVDFWGGPLDMTSANIDPEECEAYDRHWHVKYNEVKDWVADYQVNGYNEATVPEVIKNWPGNGDYPTTQDNPNYFNPNFTHFLAPYADNDGDGNYNPEQGDYPLFDLSIAQDLCIDDMLHGDEAIWWVFNDKGNIHTETGGLPIGLEIQAQAFAFATNDEMNDMTFYKYKIINRSSSQVNKTYFGVWVDADLGKYDDDYVGCDVTRGLGYCYNADADDDGPTGYGLNPPAVGVDFFRGPKADSLDGVNNDRDSFIDEAGELIIMSRFVYYNNDFTNWGNPENATDYYQYLRGIWKNGQVMTYGGDGRGGGNGATTIPCYFMFPGKTDHETSIPPSWEWGTGGQFGSAAPIQPDWNEVTAGNPTNEDRRFLQSAGPFTLTPGAVNYITTGVVWARTTQGGPVASVELLQLVDDAAQSLFNSCFKTIDGPDAPDVTLRELDNEIILSIHNAPNSNNSNEDYEELDSYFANGSTYQFEGYQIYQLKEQSVSASELDNLDRARLIFNVDKKNNVKKIVNHNYDFTVGAYISTVRADGDDKGIRHTFRVLTDAFALGDNSLINHKNYFFMVVAYGYNIKLSNDTIVDPYIYRPKHVKPYIAGRNNIKVYTAIPHNPSPENNGQVLNSAYGSGPEITRIEGTGNGYVLDYNTRATLDLTPKTVDEILSAATGYKSLNPTYAAGRGPIDVKVYDPVKVPDARFKLWLDNTDVSAHWMMQDISTNIIETSDTSIYIPNEQLFPDFGLSVNIAQVPRPMEFDTKDPGFVEGTMTFADPTKAWLTGVSDVDIPPDPHPLDWITSIGNAGHDQTQTYEKVLDGTWAPYSLCDPAEGPGASTMAPSQNLYRNLPSIDLVITSDKSKWSKCMVLEVNSNDTLVGVKKLYAKKRPSLDIDGIPVAAGGDSGRSYFPGYAINVESGERLNIMFGEDSWLAGENGNDMLWNPTSSYYSNFNQPLLGGRHYIYIVNSNHDCKNTNIASGAYVANFLMNGYDGCDLIKGLLNISGPPGRTRIAKNIAWVGFPLLVPGKQLLSTEVKIRLRVTRPYASFPTGTIVPSGSLVPGQTYVVYEGRIIHSGIDYFPHQYFTAVNDSFSISLLFGNTIGSVMTAVNKGFPLYTFSTHGLVNELNNAEAAKTALDLINVVPNPYYAYSSAEGTLIAGVVVQPQLDNRIRIVNLPSKCTISIYTVNGILVKRFNRDVAADNSYGSEVGNNGKNFETAQDWDLKNHKNVPVSSGLYLIHVEAPGLGERTIKWFGVMRPVDLDAF